MDPSLRRKRTAKRILYTLPSVAALLIAVFTLIFVFGNEIIDLANTSYRIYINAPGHDDISFIQTAAGLIEKNFDGISFSFKKNLAGGHRGEDGHLIRENNSYQLTLLRVNKRSVNRLAHDMLEAFGQDQLLMEEIVMYNALNDAWKWRKFGKFRIMNDDAEEERIDVKGISAVRQP